MTDHESTTEQPWESALAEALRVFARRGEEIREQRAKLGEPPSGEAFNEDTDCANSQLLNEQRGDSNGQVQQS